MNDNKLSTERRHEVDALRVLVLLLLIPFHSLVGFSPIAKWMLIPQNDQLLDWSFIAMSLTVFWRIPILFVISGMGIWFSLKRLSAKQLFIHRVKRIIGPLVLGWFVIGPFCQYTGSSFFAQLDQYQYGPNPHHLWFLNNILIYTIFLTPFAAYFLAGDRGQAMRQRIRKGWNRGYTPLAALLLFAIEGWVVDPKNYAAFFLNDRALFGYLCFCLGLCCAVGGSDFRNFVVRFRYVLLALAFAFWAGNHIHRYFYDEGMPNAAIGVQSLLSMGAVLGLATAHLDKTTPFFQYARFAVFPVYILHFPIQFVLSYLLFPLALSPTLKLILLITGILLLSVAIYEFVLKRVLVLDTFFGIAREK